MVNFCAVYMCGNRADRDQKSFYRLPAVITREGPQTLELSKKRREKWLSQISRELKLSNLPYVRICSDHFISGKPSTLYDCTNPDWAPTLKLGHDKVTESATSRDAARYQRSAERQKRKCDEPLPSVTNIIDCTSDSVEEDHGEAGNQTDLSAATISAMEAELQRLMGENNSLKKRLEEETAKYDRHFFKDQDERVKYFTGLPDFTTLDNLFQFIEPHMPHSRTGALTHYQELALTLMKLRLNLSHMDIAERFKINRSTSSRLFLNMVDMLYVCLRPMLVWPEREELIRTTPMSFRIHFGTKVVVILDCFEVFIDNPSNLEARALSWSSYKHNNTIKFLIGVTPQGSISYLWKGWGGRTSDKLITEQSDILPKLLHGDIVLADRGFDIADSVGATGAKLMIPCFTKGKSQLSGKDIEKTRKIANVRIHVERVIGSLRQKYSILQSTLPIDMMANDGSNTTLDKIAVICCAFTNLCPSVVPLD